MNVTNQLSNLAHNNSPTVRNIPPSFSKEQTTDINTMSSVIFEQKNESIQLNASVIKK